MLGAWFMATDYVTRPITKKGQYIYAVILGLLTGVLPYLWKFGRGRFLCHHLYQPSGSAH